MSTTLPMIQTTVNCIYAGGCLGTACTDGTRLSPETPESISCLVVSRTGICARRIPITATNDKPEQVNAKSRPDGTLRLTLNKIPTDILPSDKHYLAALESPGALMWRKGTSHWVEANGENKGRRVQHVE